jgi:uncharacterized Zn finger protein
MTYPDPAVTCACCHAEDFEVVRNDRRGFIVICSECGYARGLTLAHLQAS